MIHIGYGDSATSCLKEAIDHHGLEGERAIPSRDDFTQGPISECGNGSNFDERKEYWTKIQSELGFEMDVDDFYEESLSMLNELENENIMLWQGDSAHDILATAWLITYLEGRSISWQIIDLGRISPSDLNKGFPAVNAAMFTPEQIAGLYEYKQNVGPETINIYKDLWAAMAQENGAFRIKENNEVRSVKEDYHDSFICDNISTEWSLAAKNIEAIMGKSSHTLTDTTVEYRIRQMIKVGKVEFRGEMIDMHSYDIKKI